MDHRVKIHFHYNLAYSLLWGLERACVRAPLELKLVELE